jgi:hypothetical protein
MALYYRTEYRLGGRGRISRSYTGLQAFVAIVFDLLFGLVFELVMSVISVTLRLGFLALRIGLMVLTRSWRTMVAVTAAILSVVTLPFVVLHHTVNRLRARPEDGPRSSYAASTIKPDWALSHEV